MYVSEWVCVIKQFEIVVDFQQARCVNNPLLIVVEEPPWKVQTSDSN